MWIRTISGVLIALVQLETASPFGRWIYGAEFYRDYVDSFKRSWNGDGSFRGEEIQGPVADDSTYGMLGLFVQNVMPLGEKIELTLGSRYNYIHADVDDAEDPITNQQIAYEQDWDRLVGSARLLWHMDEAEHWNAWCGVAQGFRAPNLSDLSRLDSARSGEFETGSRSLNPEMYVSYEIGINAL